MSYPEDIGKYLNVAKETRTSEDEAYTKDDLHRRKMGRKGVGKLAALSVSKEVHVMTIKNGDKSGFILSRKVPDDTKQLQGIEERDIKFEYITEHGTSIIMKDPEYRLNKSVDSIKRNLLKIFPLVNETFRIHIVNSKQHVLIDNFDKEMIKQLGALILIGDEFKSLGEYFTNDYKGKANSENLFKEKDTISYKLSLENKAGKEQEYNLEIKGWLGVYKSTKGKKGALDTDFPDNFVSLFANNKLGEFNIIPIIGKNKLNEVYVVGQLHVDLFEETSLPDMALSNRQGYRTDDKRYEIVKREAIDLLGEITGMRTLYAKLGKQEQQKKEQEILTKQEKQLKEEVEKYNNEISNEISKGIEEITSDISLEKVRNIVETKTKKFQKAIGIKQKIEGDKKKILISQTSNDKPLADIICHMLEFNNVPAKDILYTNNDNIITHIPADQKVFDYLQKFFVDSISDKKIYIIFVTSAIMSKKWGCVLEVGASWITKSDFSIFNINDYFPEAPLNDGREWHNSKVENDKVFMTGRSINMFASRITQICRELEYEPKSIEQNIEELKNKVELI